MTALGYQPTYNGISIDSSEKTVYITNHNNPVEVTRLQANDGVIIDSK